MTFKISKTARTDRKNVVYLDKKKCIKKSKVLVGSLYTNIVATVGSQSKNETGSKRTELATFNAP
jgi:hypothetical protein